MINLENIDICIVTYNRLEYLKNCIWSILASSKIKYRLIVLSDNSTDGTNEWLLDMKKHDKVDDVIINDINLGSAKSFNKIINYSNSEWFVMACDDIYFHRGWDKASIDVINEFDDCGIVTFYNFPLNNNDSQITIINEHVCHRQSTGLAGTIINKELFIKANGFYIPDELKMGYFARGFCKNALKTDVIRKKQYITIPEYAEQMDRNNPGVIGPSPKLSREYLYSDYNKMRAIEKNKFLNIK